MFNSGGVNELEISVRLMVNGLWRNFMFIGKDMCKRAGGGVIQFNPQ